MTECPGVKCKQRKGVHAGPQCGRWLQTWEESEEAHRPARPGVTPSCPWMSNRKIQEFSLTCCVSLPSVTIPKHPRLSTHHASRQRVCFAHRVKGWKSKLHGTGSFKGCLGCITSWQGALWSVCERPEPTTRQEVRALLWKVPQPFTTTLRTKFPAPEPLQNKPHPNISCCCQSVWVGLETAVLWALKTLNSHSAFCKTEGWGLDKPCSVRADAEWRRASR